MHTVHRVFSEDGFSPKGKNGVVDQPLNVGFRDPNAQLHFQKRLHLLRFKGGGGINNRISRAETLQMGNLLRRKLPVNQRQIRQGLFGEKRVIQIRRYRHSLWNFIGRLRIFLC